MSTPVPHSQPKEAPVRQHTPTPWCVFTNPDGTKLVGIGGQDGEGILDCGFGVWSWNNPEGIANANLVVEAVNSHASLKARIEEMLAWLQMRVDAEKHPVKRSVFVECRDRLANGGAP